MKIFSKDKTSAGALLNDTALCTPAMSFRRTVEAVWQLARPYLQESPERHKAYGYMAGIGTLMLAQVGLASWLNNIQADIWQAFLPFDSQRMEHALIRLALCAPLMVASAKLLPTLREGFINHWQKWESLSLKKTWLNGNTYYGLKQAIDDADRVDGKDGASAAPDATRDPAMRMIRDVEAFINMTVNHATSIFFNSATAAWFLKELWTASAKIPLNAFGHHFNVPGYLVGAAVGYAAVTTWCAAKLGRGMSERYEEQNNAYGDYYGGIYHTHENAESIALKNGSGRINRALTHVFETLMKNRIVINRKHANSEALHTSFGTVEDVFPAGLIALASKYFSKTATSIAGLRRGAGAFHAVTSALNYFAWAYNDLSDYRATVARLSNFSRAMKRWDSERSKSSILRDSFETAAAPTGMVIRDLQVNFPDGRPMIGAFSAALRAGDRVCIVGKSGGGKTSLFRALSGLWHHGHGQVSILGSKPAFCLPQVPAFADETLRGIVCDPYDIDAFTEADVAEALRLAGLGDFVADMNNKAHKRHYWERVLSGGQKQRVGFAQMFLQQPDILLLDEVTSSLDPDAERELYGRLTAWMPRSIVISIAHRPAVQEYHTILARVADGAIQFTPIAEPAFHAEYERPLALSDGAKATHELRA